MMKAITTLFTLVAVLALSQPATAKVVSERMINGWLLEDRGDGCSLSLTRRPTLTMLIIRERGYSTLAFVDKRAAGAKEGDQATLEINVASAPSFDLPARGLITSYGDVGYLLDFPVATLAETSLDGDIRFTRDGRLVHSFPLNQVNEGVRALIECAGKYD